MSVRMALTAFCLLAAPLPGFAGGFDRLEGDALEALAAAGTPTKAAMNAADLDGLPRLFRDATGAFLVVKTDQGSHAGLLVSPALRRAPGTAGAGVPVVVVERLATFQPGRTGSRAAKGEGLILFDGFFLDLDAGIAVPDGQGGDLVFRAGGAGGPRLEVVGPAKLFVPDKLPAPGPDAPGPSAGKGVVPSDFGGRYRLFADGRWTGLLELNVGEGGRLTGRFRSEPNGTTYPVRGTLDPSAPNAVRFTVDFPMTEQEYEGRLWSEGKWGLAGTFLMTDRTFGFFALREGAQWPAPE